MGDTSTTTPTLDNINHLQNKLDSMESESSYSSQEKNSAYYDTTALNKNMKKIYLNNQIEQMKYEVLKDSPQMHPPKFVKVLMKK
jgi:hypothetical protein